MLVNVRSLILNNRTPEVIVMLSNKYIVRSILFFRKIINLLLIYGTNHRFRLEKNRRWFILL